VSTDLIILGTSTRAAAFSALRAGLSPWCVDVFADRDLQARCPARRLRGPYPRAFLDEIANAPNVPWMYTGGLENHPRLVHRLALRRPLRGTPADALRKVRDPAFLATLAKAVGLPAPRLGTWPPGPGRWMVKPKRGGGGLGVRMWSDAEPRERPHGVYVQERVEGTAVGAAFDGATLRGVTRQLVGTDWLNGPGFAYCGSVGPIAVSDHLAAKLTDLATRLVAAGVRGPFGIDGILRSEELWPIEVNPRYTASFEVLEHAARPGGSPVRVVAKGVLYARRDLTFPAEGPWLDSLDTPVQELPAHADIPAPGEAIPNGSPILTLFAHGPDEASALAALRARVEECGL
jgi:predicted ATP-grasp superfamily ATP-dependent carboligase